MKAIIFSDSHGETNLMKNIIYENPDIEMIIHLGDLVRDALELQCENPDVKMLCVAGNNDWYSDEPTERLIELYGKKIFMTHGNHYGVKNGLSKITERAKNLKAEVVLFGHTHVPYNGYTDNTLLINPGSTALPAKGARRSCCLMDITSNGIKTEFYNL